MPPIEKANDNTQPLIFFYLEEFQGGFSVGSQGKNNTCTYNNLDDYYLVTLYNRSQ